MAANPLVQYQAALRKQFPQIPAMGLKFSVSFVGSFINVRIADPEGLVPMKLFQEVCNFSRSMLSEYIGPNQTGAGYPCYFMKGCCITWIRN